MYLKRKKELTLSKDSPVRQGFRSPFRSPRPSSNNNVESEKASSVGQASPNSVVDASKCDSQTYREVMAVPSVKVTPSKSVSLSSHTTPQNTSGRLREVPSKLLSKQFVSPFQSPRNKLFQQQTETPEEQLANLIKEEIELDKDINALKEKGFKTEELKGHIDRLHRYNDVKDAAQLVLGRLAEIERVTLKEMHKKYNVPSDEYY